MSHTKQLHHAIISKCKCNDAKAQMQLYKLYCNGMFLVAKRYVKETAIAEDVMQDAFIKAFKNIHSYKGEVSIGAWIKRIVINQSIDELKKKKLEIVAINDEVHTVEDEKWTINDGISMQQIIDSIQALKEKYRVVLSLYLLEGYDHKEISEILGITEVTSRTHLMRGKKIVKESLKAIRYA
ncbi:RNA polymerase sigma-70 factor (ECF subfamily) [Lutibacter sp. Hel_I_33_5]|uniref:RNA polymerase sigma factor n=1 Tax=Lutibacter sp. Hel_I_33_5 TaxID=1566289 RepID=UPI0011A5FB77|nr:sigma-70 family RNA polymerase sigma factor [Lutibacter sp. Hel_I_33_5]TVZ57372.1 RNA polymerase sigma-70 factor (ECF subfamily) [Lutibacter sp. Hel_I_33_5]